MVADEISIDQRVRIRCRLMDADVYGRVMAKRGNGALVQATERDESILFMTPGTEVDVIAFGLHEVVMFPSRILDDRGNCIAISLPSGARIERQRGVYRKRCEIEAVYWNTQRPTQKVKAVIEDISLGGVLLKTASAPEVGAQLGIFFELPDLSYEVEANIEVVRVLHQPGMSEDTGTQRVGCVFTNVSRITSGMIDQYLAAGAGEAESPPARRVAGANG